MTATLRRATDRDLDVVVRLRLAFIAELRGVDPTSFDPTFVDATRTYLQDVTHVGDIRTWLAHDTDVDVDGAAVGIVSVLRNHAPPLPEQHLAHEGYLVNLWVVPTARRRGLARALVQAAIDDAPTWGLRRLSLFATDDGRPLYEQTGFAPDPRWMGLRIADPG